MPVTKRTAGKRNRKVLIGRRWTAIERGFDRFQEELAAQRREADKGFQKIKEANEQGLQKLKETNEQDLRKLKEANEQLKETNEKDLRKLKEANEQLKEANESKWQKLEEAGEKSMRELREAHQETEKALKAAQRIVGDLGNRFGDLAEQMLVPDLADKFESFGFVFGELGRNVKWKSREHNFSMEFDALLKNDEQAMVVEVKTKLDKADVDEQLVRMQNTRRYADLRGDRRQYYGAIAALTASDRMIEYALANGFFMILPSGEDVAITRPASGPRVW